MAHRARAPRGSLLMYAIAFGLMLAAGACFAAAAKGFLESTRLLWVSAACSVAAIVAAVAGVFVPRQR